MIEIEATITGIALLLAVINMSINMLSLIRTNNQYRLNGHRHHMYKMLQGKSTLARTGIETVAVGVAVVVGWHSLAIVIGIHILAGEYYYHKLMQQMNNNF